jgi:hypothetical protein
LIALLMSFSLTACQNHARVDATCQTQATQASPALKRWFARLCDKNGVCKRPAPPDLSQFLRDVAANNAIIKANCPGGP